MTHALSLFAGWTEERTERLKKMWANGRSASQIALALGGVTRNGVLGKIWRLGLPTHSGAVRQANQSAAQRGRHRPRPSMPRPAGSRPALAIAGNGTVFEKAPVLSEPIPIRAAAWEPLPGVAPVSILDLCPTHCRWPLDLDGIDLPHACGGLAAVDRYCLVHAERSLAPVQPKTTTKDLIRMFRGAA